MNSRVKKIAKFALRWGIAVVGIWYVLSNLSWFDYVMVADPATGLPVKVRIAGSAEEADKQFKVLWPGPNRTTRVQVFERSQLINRPDYDTITVRDPQTGQTREVQVVGRAVTEGRKFSEWPLVTVPPRGLWDRYWNTYPPGTLATQVDPREVINPTTPPRLQYPLVEEGLRDRVSGANPWWLVLAMVIFPAVYFITAYRWWVLMRIVDVRMSLRRAFAINMVGSFYNTFLLGSTGGDVLKAIYAARNSQHRTRAVVSVMVDRVIGLYGLILLGGTIAGATWLGSRGDAESYAVSERCKQVFAVSVLILIATAVALTIYYLPPVRRLLRIDAVFARLPMQRHVVKIRETLDLYGKHPAAVLGTVMMSLPVHGIMVISVSLACMAFGLPLTWWYYWVVVPITVLSGAIPISPQGAGVMEFVAFVLMRSQRGTVTDVVAMTMSIRLIGILWNLTGGIFVLRGGYSQPANPERELEDDLERDVPGAQIADSR